MAMTAFWSTQLVLALVLNCAVQAIQIGAYAARLAGVRSGRIGTSISLFNLFVTASRFANLIYAPMLGTISDRTAHAVRNPLYADAAIHQFEIQIRLIVLAGTVGTVLGALLLTEVLNAVAFLGLSETYQYVFQGTLILIAALIYSTVQKREGA